MTLVLLMGLGLLGAGAFRLAGAVRRTEVLPGWAAVVFALGLALWCPILPRPVRVLDGLLIGIGGVALARELWQDRPRRSGSPVLRGAAVEPS